jgi:hypothetical protein
MTSALHAPENVALINPITNKNASRLDSILWFKKGPTRTMTKISDKPIVNRGFAMTLCYMTARSLEAMVVPQNLF